MDSGIAYEWVRQTGEKVWTVNVGYGGSSITQWQKGGIHYEACLELFAACLETLHKEIAAGHFTLSHMAYFWCQGCADENQTAAWYADQYLQMHETLQEDMAFDEDVTFEFAGIIPIRSGHDFVNSYRAGVYKDTTTVPYHQSFKDLQFNGPRVAQYWMGNNPELSSRCRQQLTQIRLYAATLKFMQYEMVYLPKIHFIREETQVNDPP